MLQTSNYIICLMLRQEQEAGFQMQCFPPLQSELCPLNQQKTEPGPEELPPCRIRRRVIERISLKQNIKKNKNIPKNIIGNFRKILPKYKDHYEEGSFSQVSNKVLQWHRNGFDINLWHLNDLFGENEPKSSYVNRLVLRQMLSAHDLDIIGEETKVQNILTYLIGIHQYMFRLGNGKLTRRVQSK